MFANASTLRGVPQWSEVKLSRQSAVECLELPTATGCTRLDVGVGATVMRHQPSLPDPYGIEAVIVRAWKHPPPPPPPPPTVSIADHSCRSMTADGKKRDPIGKCFVLGRGALQFASYQPAIALATTPCDKGAEPRCDLDCESTEGSVERRRHKTPWAVITCSALTYATADSMQDML
ncbi:unnamed protein product, partial [Iphiclides podalirius]